MDNIEETRFIPPDLLRMIEIGDAVIHQVRALRSLGAQNLVRESTAENARGLLRARYEKALLRAAKPNRTSLPIRPIAVAAVRHRSGNCQEAAAIAYCLLRGYVELFDICISTVAPEFDHGFVCIGDPRILPADRVVVVDAWPYEPQAVTLADHFCRAYRLRVARKTTSGKPGNFGAMMEKYELGRYAGIAQRALAIGFPSNSPAPTFDQRRCSASGNRILYRAA
ncbi:MAG: hypothetical protein INR65_04500 [Gluconacetobacter diazotrophicus]|nr:hypothetical protein [Gluconacetobacter diazotrophicus]